MVEIRSTHEAGIARLRESFKSTGQGAFDFTKRSGVQRDGAAMRDGLRAVTNCEIIAGEAARCSSRAAHGADSRFARRRPVKNTPAFTGSPLKVVSRGAREADRASSITRVGCGTGGLEVLDTSVANVALPHIAGSL